MRVLFLSQWFPPEPSRVPVAVTQSLADRGADVRVVTGTPNYPTGDVPDGWSATRYRREHHRGWPVLHSPLYPSHDRATFKRILNYLSFAAAASIGTLGWAPARHAEVTLVYGSPATAAMPAMILRLARGVPYVIYVQDLWPDSITATGFFQGRIARKILVPILERMVGLTYRWADAVAVISPGMERELHSRGVPQSKTMLIHNWIGGEAPPVHGAPASGRFNIVYGGTVGRAQGLDVVVRAVSLVEDQDVHVHFIGDGVEVDHLKSLAEELIPGQASFTPRVPLTAFQERAAEASLMLVCLRDDPLFDITLPSKVQSSLGMGLPLLASGGRDIRELVLAAGAGWAAPAGDAEALAREIADAKSAGSLERARRGRAGRAYFDAHLTESVNGSKLYGLLAAVTGGRSAEPSR